MPETTVNAFRRNMESKVDTTIANHEVLRVKRKGGNFVVIGERDWEAIEETLYINQLPGLDDGIYQAGRDHVHESSPLDDLDW